MNHCRWRCWGLHLVRVAGCQPTPPDPPERILTRTKKNSPCLVKMSRYRCLRANGMCGQCGKVPSKKTRCSTCRKKASTSRKACYKRKRESNRCTQCNTEHKGKGGRCKTCLEKRKASYKCKRDSNLCWGCSKRHEGEGTYCATCREERKASYKRKRESNRCVQCNTEHEEEGTRCKTCREKNRERDKPCRDVWIAWKHKACACGCSDWRVIGASNPDGHEFSDYPWWTSHGGPEALEAALVGATPICRNCRRKTKKRSNRRWVREEKERRKACAFCGLVDDPRVYEFDHIGTKEFEVHKAKTKKAFLKEVEKCQMLCANCHHVKTHYGGQGRLKPSISFCVSE